MTLGLVVGTPSVLGGVWVSRFTFLEVLFGVHEGVSLPSSLTSVGSGITVDEFLFSKAHELSGLDGVVSFNGGGGGESPA